jgi:hypothetical protein
MALSSFTVANYRSFLRPTTLELRPLTLLFGYNNSGKSALLRVLPLLADSVGTPRGAPLNLDSAAVRGAAFRDLCSQLSSSRQVAFTLRWDESERVSEYRFWIRDLDVPLSPAVSRFEVAASGEGYPLQAVWQPQATNHTLYEFEMSGATLMQRSCAFRGIRPDLQDLGGTMEELKLALSIQGVAVQLQYLRDDIRWLGAVRRVPPRIGEFRGTAPNRLLEDGAGVLEILIQDKVQGGTLLPTVSAWFEKHTRQRLDVTELAPRYYALTLGPLASPGVRVNVIDTGEGMAQVLPVLVLGAQARAQGRANTLVTLEQPELHLHPALHAPLADFFCEMAMQENPPRALIETHSENFLQGLQLAIVQGRLDPARVGVYWVQQLDDGSSTVDLITFDDKGLPSRWPPGVFAEDTELARRILKERRAKEGA